MSHHLIQLKCYILLILILLLILAKPKLVLAQTQNYTPSWITYIGGNADTDYIRDVASDSQGNVYITGGTSSTDFPTSFPVSTIGTPNRTGGSCPTTPTDYTGTGFDPGWDVFLTKFSPQGQILWTRIIGGPCYDRAYAIELDPTGNIYIAGRAGYHFPTGNFTNNAISDKNVLSPDLTPSQELGGRYGLQDAFILKLDSNGNPIWGTYLSNPDNNVIRDIAVDDQGTVYAALTTTKFPYPASYIKNTNQTTAIQSQLRETAYGDAAVIVVDKDGKNVVYGTYLGGSLLDGDVPSIRVDSSHNAYVLFGTKSNDIFPTVNGYQPQNRSGGNPNNPQDLFLAKINPTGTAILYAAFIGGTNGEGGETHYLDVNSNGQAYISTGTNSPDFCSVLPITCGYQNTLKGANTFDLFVVSINTNLSGTNSLSGATLFGGIGNDGGEGIALQSDGVFVGGTTSSPDIYTTTNAYRKTYQQNGDGYFVKFALDLKSVIYSTYIGGSGNDGHRAMGFIKDNGLIVAGPTTSTNFPITSNAVIPGKSSNLDAWIGVFTPPSTNFSPEDLDRDGDVDFLDLIFLIKEYSASPFNPTADINQDSQVNLFDFNLLVSSLISN